MIHQFRNDIISGRTSAVEIAKQYLADAKTRNAKLNSFLVFCDDLAKESAARIDKKIKEGRPLGKLAGVPIAIKDNILVKGYNATAASAILENYHASYDADVARFLRNEDALIIGKTNMDEFAMGSSSESSAFGRVKNPIDPNLVPGGSSGGSSVAVASGQVPVALGSDTGGSIRQPASFTGVVGLKPTYGRVSRFGLIAMASSLDQIGVFTHDIHDAALLLEVLSQKTHFDSTHAGKEYSFPSLRPEEAKERLCASTVGVPKEFFGKGLDPKIAEAIKKTLGILEKAGVRVKELSLPSLEYALACYYIIMPAEASSNLARYDGIRYGKLQTTNYKLQTTIDWYLDTRGKGFGIEVRRRIMLGTYVLSAGYIDKYYVKSQKVRQAILTEFNEAFNQVDVILGPTSPIFPFKAGEKLNDPLSMYLSDIYTVAPNLAGLPAISLPLPNLPLPAGLQIIAPHFEEERLLAISQGIMNFWS